MWTCPHLHSAGLECHGQDGWLSPPRACVQQHPTALQRQPRVRNAVPIAGERKRKAAGGGNANVVAGLQKQLAVLAARRRAQPVSVTDDDHMRGNARDWNVGRARGDHARAAAGS
jgi:hypothetical protein